MNLNAVVKGHARRSRVLFIYAADLTLCEEIACAEPPTISHASTPEFRVHPYLKHVPFRLMSPRLAGDDHRFQPTASSAGIQLEEKT